MSTDATTPAPHHHDEPPRLTLEETAVDACSRKRHAVSRGYYADPYLQHFTRDATYLNSPLMNRGYWLRVRAVESAINRFVQALPADSKLQVVSIGGGYDTTFFRWAGLACDASKENPAQSPAPQDSEAAAHEARDFALSHASPAGALLRSGRLHRFVEVDQPAVVRSKQAVIRHHADLAALASLVSGEPCDKPRTAVPTADAAARADVFRLVGADLRHFDEVRAALVAGGGAGNTDVAAEVPIFGPKPHASPVLDPTVPTIVIAECVLVYMRSDESEAVVRGLTSLFAPAPQFAMLAYDAIRPATPFGKQMIANLAARGLELRGIHDMPTPEHHMRRYGKEGAGLPSVSVWTMKELFEQVPRPVVQRLQHIEMCDDYDEWCLVHEHYSMSWAGRFAAAAASGADAASAAPPRLFF